MPEGLDRARYESRLGIDGSPQVDDAGQAAAPAAAEARSATRSSASSRPIETRIMPGVSPAAASSGSPSCRWDDEAGWLHRVSTLPRLVACTALRSRS